MGTRIAGEQDHAVLTAEWQTGIRMAVAAMRTLLLVWLVVSLSAGQSEEAAAKIRKAGELMQAGKTEEAIPLFRELAEAYPAVPSFGINLAVAQYKAGRYRDAIEQCKALIKLRDDIFPAWLFLGASYLESGDAAAAVEPLRKALTLQPTDRNARVMLADALLAESDFAEAAAQFEQAQTTLPDSPRVAYGLARAYDGLAVEVLGRLLQIAPRSAELLALAGDAEFERSQFALAFRRYREALAADATFEGLHTSLAAIYDQTGHPEWAAVERAKEPVVTRDCSTPSPACDFAAGKFGELRTAPASTPAALYWQCRALRELAKNAYARLAGLPDSAEKHEAEARADERAARYPEAAAAWKEALKLSPKDTVRRQLALALCHSNDCGSALPLVKELLAREPGSAEFNYLYGKALTTMQDAGQALPYLEKAAALDDRLLAARAELGQAYLAAGNPERAVPQLEAAIAEDEDGSRHYQLARAYQAAGKPEQAAATLRQYREILSRREVEEKNEPRVTPP